MGRIPTAICRKCSKEFAAACEACPYCGTYLFKTDKPEHRTIFIVVGVAATICISLTAVVVGALEWHDLAYASPAILFLGIGTTLALAHEFYGGGSSGGGVSVNDHDWLRLTSGLLKTTPPRFDDMRRVMCCAEGRDIPYSETTVGIYTSPTVLGAEDVLVMPQIHWVYAQAGRETFNLKLFPNIQRAKEYAREIRLKVAAGSSGTPWFPPDD
ncbi:hypothetical protein ACFL3B_05680 [Gemmatimonadota bacterium]